MQHELKAREYKLLLEPRSAPQPSLEAVGAFWERQLRPIIVRRLDPRDGNKPRHEQTFLTVEERLIRFRDTQGCVLTNKDYALRERVSAHSDARAASIGEITLKLRMPDMFVVASTDLSGSEGGAQTKLEEDIAPLEISDPHHQNGSIAVSRPRSMRSRFSLSTSQACPAGRRPCTLADIFVLFPTLEDQLQRAGARFSPSHVLYDGPLIREFVFKGAKVRLGDNITGKFALTLWQFGDAEQEQEIAEISFKCKTLDGLMPGNAARRAFDLFIGLQEDLANGINLHHASKTALALPLRCKGAS